MLEYTIKRMQGNPSVSKSQSVRRRLDDRQSTAAMGQSLSKQHVDI